MIDRQFKKLIIECDSCNATFSGDEGEDFETVWRAAKRDGWKAAKVAGEWLHGCQRCGVK